MEKVTSLRIGTSQKCAPGSFDLKEKSVHYSAQNPKIFLSKINQSPFYKTIAMQVRKTDRTGSLLKIKVSRKHNNVLGIVHGGVMASLLDSACSMSVIPFLNNGETIVTLGLQIQYFSLIKSEEITAHGTVVHYGRRMAYAEATILDKQEQIIAKGSASFMIIGKPAAKRNMSKKT